MLILWDGLSDFGILKNRKGEIFMIKISRKIILLSLIFLISFSICSASDEVLNTYPKDGEMNVPVDSKIKIFFGMEKNPSDYIFVFTPSVEGTVTSYSNSIIFKPEKPLTGETGYKVTVKNKSGDVLIVWGFTTESATYDDVITTEVLNNMTYTIYYPQSGARQQLIKFEDGEYENAPQNYDWKNDPYIFGYGTIKQILFSDLNGDSKKDAVVLFCYSIGVGFCSVLTAVLEKNGKAVPIDRPELLGRVNIDYIKINGSNISIYIIESMDDHNLNRDCWTYQLQGEKLVLQSKTDY